MSEPGWRVCHTSVIGSSHIRTGAPCQDTCGFEYLEGTSDGALLLYASDGAGSASRSDEGAAQVCDSFKEFFGRLLLRGKNVGDIRTTECIDWVLEAREWLGIVAEETGAQLRDFACTFLGVIIGNSGCICLQIGDGAIVFSTEDSPDAYSPAIWPDEGEFANLTYFITGQESENHLHVQRIEEKVCEMALFTDGLEHLALHMATKTAHTPFFQAFFRPLRNEPFGFSQVQSDQIAAFLASEMVLARTDDDKTLLLASRFESKPENKVHEAL
ncbi:MAG: protein phosphatase 2C domain-containing protein [Verrucomicrobiaceae bacterium]|nr:MAG: protein phosphatase 2C domain-containing protein [Verrucomicrobiaceae bacterium]